MGIKCINYWCNHCLEHKNTKGLYYNTNHRGTWERHLSSKKHIKCLEVVKNDPDKINCKYCKTDFTEEGFVDHGKLNKELWHIYDSKEIPNIYLRKSDAFKNVSCNNFVDFTGQRHDTIKKVRLAYIMKQNNQPITPKTIEKEYAKLEVVDKVYEKEVEEEIEEIPEGVDIEETDPLVLEWRKNDEEYEIRDDVERPTFDETCYGCGLPENNEKYKMDLLNLFDVQVCECLEEY